MAKHDGGPAYPVVTPDMIVDGTSGMSLRDYFAGQALERCIGLCMESDGSWDPVNVAACAYNVADAMLAAREEVES